MQSASPASTTRARFRFAARQWLVWLAFFLLVLGVRLVLVAQFGSAMPLLDQWDDEAARILKPHLEGTLGLRDFFVPHNEHRPLLSRCLALALLTLNGQWDARLQMTVNAGIAALLAVIIASLGVRLVGSRHRSSVLAAVGCWSCLPFAWENTTWAFQSSFYFLVLFSVVAIWKLITCLPFSRGWLLGTLSAFLASISMGSGFLCAAAVAVVVALRWMIHRPAARDVLPTLAVCAAIVMTGLSLRVHVAGHDVYRAESIQQWLDVFGRAAAWPFTHFTVAFVLMNLPVALLTLQYLRRRRMAAASVVARTETILTIAAWVWLQAAAIAYSRGGGIAEFIPSRYMDILGLGAVANLLAVLALLAEAPLRARRVLHPSAAVWTSLVFVGAVALSHRGWRDLRGRAEQVRAAEAQVRAYVATGNAAQLVGDAVLIAYPWLDRLAGLLADPTIRRILPAAVRAPLTLEPDGTSGPFIALSSDGGERIWSSESNAHATRDEFRSRPVRPALPLVRLQMRGALAEGISLKILHDRTRRRNGVSFDRNPAGWRNGYAAVDGEFRVVARDENAERALAFSEPREVGRLSYLAEQLLARRRGVLLTALALVVGLGAHGAFSRAGRLATEPAAQAP